MNRGLVARASIVINAPIYIVWGALTKPKIIKQYMFGTDVVTDWQVGSSIVWKGEWQGKTYEDKGKILKFETEHILEYSHFSPLSGDPDVPEKYHNMTIELKMKGNQTKITLLQDNNTTEEDRKHSETNWKMMLEGMKKLPDQYLSENPSCRIEDIEK